MKKQGWVIRLAGFLLAAVVTLAAPAVRSSAESGTQAYVENEWNYVSAAMDVSHGIPDSAVGVLDRIHRKGVLRVAAEMAYPPYVFADPARTGQERYVGADMELARLIAERMGVELEILPMEFMQILPSLTEDQCDLTLSALSFTPARATSYTLSRGYYFTENPQVTGFMVLEENRDKITSLEDLADKVLAVQGSTLQESQAVGHVRVYKEFRRLPSAQAVYEAVRTGKADASAVEIDKAEEYIRKHPDDGLCLVEGLTFALDDEYLGYRVAAKKGETQLMYFVNGVIEEVLEDGAYQRWLEEARQRAEELGL